MFTLFKSKKQKSELKKIEKQDSFYEAEDDDDLNLGDNAAEMNDSEYNRRVTEEIAKRKSLAKTIPVPKASPVSSKAVTANAFSSKSPASNISPVAKGVTSAKNGFVAAPSPRTPAVSQKNTPAKTSAASTPISSRPNTAPSTPVTSASSPHRDGFATPSLVRASNVASRPNSATSTPRNIPSRNGFVADPKGLQQLVSMGFSYPASTLALMKNDNRIDLATEYLLERSDDEINKLLALESAGAANSAKKAAQAASAPPAPVAASAPAPVPSPPKREVSTRGVSKKGKGLSIQTGPQSEESAPSKSPATLARVPSARLNPGHAAANTAMAAILAKRDALKKSDDKKPNGASPSPGDGPSTPSPTRESSFNRLSSYKTKGQILREQKEEENRRHDEAQEARRKNLREMALASKDSLGGIPNAAGSPASPGNPAVPVLENSAFESLHLKKTKSLMLAEEINEAKRAEKAEKDKELQERPLLVRQASSVLKRQASADFSAANSVVTTFTPVADPKAFENLYKKKTHAMLLAERAEEMQREEIEAHRAELQAQAARRKLLRDASPGSTRQRANSSDTITTCSTLNKSGTFESLYATKTRSQQLADEDEEKRRRHKEAQDRKWKLAVTPRSSFNGTASDAGSVMTQENNEVFEKLYAKKRVSQEIGEKVAMEEKVHREKVEARESGKSGSALPETSPSALLKKTKSMYLREQLMGEERQQRQEVRSAEKELILAPRNNARARAESNDGSNTARRSLMSASDDSALSELTPFSMYREHSNANLRTGNLLDGIGATMVDDDFDSEDEDEDRMPSLNVAERPANHARNSPSTQMQHKNSDFFKFGQSFYGNESKSFRSSKNGSNSFRKSDGGGNANSASRRAMVATRIEDIKGIVRRTTLPSEVLETSDHSWTGKVTIPANPILGLPQSVETLKGMFESKAQCTAITAAYAPPVMADSKKKTACKVCEEAFNKYLKPEHCHNCGQMVCADCSDESWPRSMLPHTYFSEKKGKARVCSACNQLMEKLVTALKAGNMDEVITLHEIGNVNFHFPLTIYPDAPYPIHCAAGSGNVGLVEWLVEKQHCPTKDFRTGEPLMNAAGHTILAVAARKGDVTMMSYCLHHLHSSVQEITDIAALQRGLHAALESPGPMPSIGFKKPPKSPLVTPATSFRRYESTDISGQEETATVPETGTLQEKAAELAEKLKAAQAAQAPAAMVVDGSTENLAGHLVSSLGSAQDNAGAILVLANGSASSADPAANQLPVFESEVSLEFAAMAPSSLCAAESTTLSSQEASGLSVEVGPTNTDSTDAESSSSADPNSFSVNHRGLAVRSLSASNVHTAVSARGEQNQSQSFVTGPKRMNSTKVEPVEDEGPKSRITLPRSPSAQNSTLQADIQAAARAEVKDEARGEVGVVA